MSEIDLQEIKNKTTTSVIFLSLRNIGIQAISFFGFFLLSVLLKKEEIGVFALIVEIIGILGYFSDVGLAAALIQQKDEVTKDELQTTFMIQQCLVIVGLIIFWLIYHKTVGQYLWLSITLCFSFVCASLKTIPSVLLERKLNFKIISTVDVVENICFYVVAVIFAFLGFGVTSYAIAVTVRSLVGLIWLYKVSPWPIGFDFSYSALKKLFKFGIPFQLNSFIAMIKDRVPNVLVAKYIGVGNFGLLSWAQKGPRTPLSFMDAIQRVTFPTFARIQDKKELLTTSIKKSVFFIALFIFPALTGIALIAPDLINLIAQYVKPDYVKWLPAVFPLYLYCISFAIAAITTPLTNAFNAVGKITITTGLMIMWTALTWIFFPLLSIRYGYMGTAWAALIVGSSSVVVWIIAKKLFNFSTINNIKHPLIASLLMLVVLFKANIFIKVIGGVSIYCLYQFIFSKQEIYWFLEQLKCFRTKK